MGGGVRVVFGRARLAENVQPLDSQRLACSARGDDAVQHAVFHRGPYFIGPGEGVDERVVVGDDEFRSEDATGRDGACVDGHLEGRYDPVALPDGGVCGVSRMPDGIAFTLRTDPFGREGDAGGFVPPEERVEPFPQTDEGGEFRQFGVVETAADFAEIGVAGIGQCGNDGQFTMAVFGRAADSLLLRQLEEARAVQIFVWRDDPLLQGRQGDERLDGGAWRIVACERTAAHGAASGLEILRPQRKMMGRHGGHDVDLPVDGVHDNQRAFEPLAGENLLRGLLQFDVDRQRDVLSGHGLFRFDRFMPVGENVGLEKLVTVRAAQLVVAGEFDAALSDELLEIERPQGGIRRGGFVLRTEAPDLRGDGFMGIDAFP